MFTKKLFYEAAKLSKDMTTAIQQIFWENLITESNLIIFKQIIGIGPTCSHHSPWAKV
jgi:hypothetical protein